MQQTRSNSTVVKKNKTERETSRSFSAGVSSHLTTSKLQFLFVLKTNGKNGKMGIMGIMGKMGGVARGYGFTVFRWHIPIPHLRIHIIVIIYIYIYIYILYVKKEERMPKNTVKASPNGLNNNGINGKVGGEGIPIFPILPIYTINPFIPLKGGDTVIRTDSDGQKVVCAYCDGNHYNYECKCYGCYLAPCRILASSDCVECDKKFLQ